MTERVNCNYCFCNHGIFAFLFSAKPCPYVSVPGVHIFQIYGDLFPNILFPFCLGGVSPSRVNVFVFSLPKSMGEGGVSALLDKITSIPMAKGFPGLKGSEEAFSFTSTPHKSSPIQHAN